MVLGGRPPGRVGRSHVIFFYICDMFHEEHYSIKHNITINRNYKKLNYIENYGNI